MSDVMLPLEPADELYRLTLASSLRDAGLAKLERAITQERVKKAVLLKAAKVVLNAVSLDVYRMAAADMGRMTEAQQAMDRLRAAIAEAEKESV